MDVVGRRALQRRRRRRRLRGGLRGPPAARSLVPDPGGGAPPPGEYLVFTRGDEVSAVGASGLAAFLAPVDTPAEAAFLAQVATQGSVDCTIPSAVEVEGGYEIYLVRTQPCGGQVVELRVFVSETAETSVVEQVTVNEGEDILCP
ncbi:MAG: hypothetical protein M5U28_52910 [Sandaracinaceae bacterium]|nr:hypothetical protein [Sandaracinaceae bacterium]